MINNILFILFDIYAFNHNNIIMPKQIFDSFFRSLIRDIQCNYKDGDKYLSVRGISKKFNVSLQTAQKGVTQLVLENKIDSKPKSGIIIKKNLETNILKGKKIIVMSNKQDGHFYSSFFDGVKLAVEEFDIKADFMLNTFPDTQSLGFGQYLASLETDGLIMLSFPNSALPFYHAMREGVDIVSDIILDDLPILPSRQTDNYKHAQEAGEILLSQGCKKFFIFGYYPKKNKRYFGFNDVITKTGYSTEYIELSSMSGVSKLSELLKNSDDSVGFFSSDYSANYVLDILCSKEKVKPKHVLVFDADDKYFKSQYLPPIKAVGPSFQNIGASLGALLIEKWLKGNFPAPLQNKI